MASFTTEDNMNWLWGSLKPWQILHSTLAERERCGKVLDVWELVNETLSASTTRVQEAGDGGRSHGMHFLGDIMDGDFWRHGGVMESRVKACLIARKDEEAAEEELAAAQYAQQLSAVHHHHHHRRPSIRECRTIASNTQLSCAPRSVAWKYAAAADADDQHYCKVEGEKEEADDQEEMLDLAAAAEEREEEIEDEEEPAIVEGYIEEEEEDEDSRCSAPYTRSSRELNYTVISSNYEANPNYREISRDSGSVLVLNPCCSAVLVGAAAGDDEGAKTEWGAETAKLAEGMAAPPEVEENIEVCAVCLEKLTHYYEEGVQALACRHAFHTVCIAPWLQRQPHACCPCCRAPILSANLGAPLHLAAPLDLAADHYRLRDRYACAEVDQQPAAADEVRAGNDIMGLLADMEAALERLGFRS